MFRRKIREWTRRTGLTSSLLTRIREWRRRREVRDLVKGAIQGYEEMDAEDQRLRGTWFCDRCEHEGGEPTAGSVTRELSYGRLYKVGDCPACGAHAFEVGGDEGEPVAEDYPLPEFPPQGPCPRCGSTDTVQIVYGLPSDALFLAANRGKVKLGGCMIIETIEGGRGPLSSCRACRANW